MTVFSGNNDGGFCLHPTLEKDTIWIDSWQLCEVLLMNDANYPWVILVPRVGPCHVETSQYVREIYELSEANQHQFWKESAYLGENLMHAFEGEKLNIGALGNMVPQLHVHHIVRTSNDPAWPAPVWGRVPAVPLVEPLLSDWIGRLRAFSAQG